MHIQDIQLSEVKIPMRAPFKTALRTIDTIHDVVVRVVADNGLVGYGSAPPTAVITGETMESIRGAILGHIRPALLGMDVENLDGLMTKLHKCMVHNTSAKAAVDIAVMDLWARNLGQPLYKLLGGARTAIETDYTISVDTVDAMVTASLEAKARGYRALKIKVGKEGKADIARVAAIRQAVGNEAILRVDANQGWTAKQSVSIISAMEDMGLDIDLVEQPVPYWDLDGMAYVTQRVATPILADESVFSPKDAVEILHRGAADLLNIKLMKVGGIWQALKLCDIAESCGVECMIGCMMESRISVAAAAHLAAARNIITRVDLDGPAMCLEDPFEGGPQFEEANITMTQDPGVGLTQLPCTLWT